MLLPAARELLASNPTIDMAFLAVVPFLFAALFTRWFVRDGADRTLHVR